MDPFSVVAGAIGIAGVGGQAVQAVQTARDFFGDYHHGEAQMMHVKAKSDILESIRQSSPIKLNPNLVAAQSSFETISASFPGNLHTGSRRRRLLWAAKDKERATRLLGQLAEIEISTILALHLNQSSDIDKIQSSIKELKNKLVVMEEEKLVKERLQYAEPTPLIIPPTQHSHLSQTRVHRWLTIRNRNLNAVQLLLEMGADPNLTYGNWET
ncbi:hypothetical protein B0O99DRAFT_695856 [Bisporella sp. PMI_857]|nr:hypothetical protein B0O99DRAFT_695856 [Bisporella sp. PMI_857]